MRRAGENIDISKTDGLAHVYTEIFSVPTFLSVCNKLSYSVCYKYFLEILDFIKIFIDPFLRMNIFVTNNKPITMEMPTKPPETIKIVIEYT